MNDALLANVDRLYLGNTSFVDYELFEGDSDHRQKENEAFIAGDKPLPKYDYPKLNLLYRPTASEKSSAANIISAKKRAIQRAFNELELHKREGRITPELYEMYSSSNATCLRKILLVEEACRLHYGERPAVRTLARLRFMKLNRKLYGDIDNKIFAGIMNTEQQRVHNFVPANQRAEHVKRYLESYFMFHRFTVSETPLLNESSLKMLHDKIMQRYQTVLAVVPDTPNTVVYTVRECADIMQHALRVCGLEEHGWKIRISRTKANPSTNGDARVIYLPVSTRRTADQLRRLIIHEIEVHARRSQNGAEHGLRPLHKGTASYASAEEGLGVLLECAVAGKLNNPSFDRARDRYMAAGLALGADGLPRNAANTFSILWRLLALRMTKHGVLDHDSEMAAKSQAMKHIENAFRGTNFAGQGVIYAKLKVYYEGLVRNADYFGTHIHDLDGALDRALLGKYNHVNDREYRLVTRLITAKHNRLVELNFHMVNNKH